MALAKTEVKELAEEVWKKLSEGDTEEDIMDVMGIEPEDYILIRKAMMEEQAAQFRSLAPEHMYVEYVLWQKRGIADLTDLIQKQKARTSPNANAMVAAIKVRGDMYDKIIARGQEFGVLKKMPDMKATVGGLFVADLTSEKLRTQVTTAISEMDKLMKRYGDTDILGVDPGSLHYGPKLLTDSSSDKAEILIEAPPAKDDMLAIVAKPPPSGPKGKPTTKKSIKPPSKVKTRGLKKRSVLDENRKKKAAALDLSRWGD